MKKILYRLLYICVITITITLIGKALIMLLYTQTTFDQQPHNYSNKSYKITAKNSLTHNIGYNLLRPIIESRIDHYIQKNGLAEYLAQIKYKTIKPDSFKIYDITEGNSKKALCGQDISVIIYKYSYNENTNKIKALSNIPQEIKFKLGESVIKELNYAIEGMQEESARIVILTDQEGNLKEQYYIKLTSINSLYPEEINDMLIFNNIIEDYEGIVNKIRCGDHVKLRYNIRDSNGKLILENQELNMVVGKNQAPLAIELGIINMRSDMTRSIIASPNLLTNFDKPKNFDENSVKIIDINTIE